MGTDNVRGKAKETVGKATDDEALERQGQQDQAKGSIKDAGRKAQEAAKKAKEAITDD